MGEDEQRILRAITDGIWECPLCTHYDYGEISGGGCSIYDFCEARPCIAWELKEKKRPTLSATVSVKPTEEGNIKGLDVTCGDTTFIPVEVEDDDR